MVRAAGDFDFSRTDLTNLSLKDCPTEDENDEAEDDKTSQQQYSIPFNPLPPAPSAVDITTYTPDVRNRVWYISETDLTFISAGCCKLPSCLSPLSPFLPALKLNTNNPS